MVVYQVRVTKRAVQRERKRLILKSGLDRKVGFDAANFLSCLSAPWGVEKQLGRRRAGELIPHEVTWLNPFRHEQISDVEIVETTSDNVRGVYVKNLHRDSFDRQDRKTPVRRNPSCAVAKARSLSAIL